MKADIEKIAKSSGDSFMGWSTAYGYQTSAWLGRLRFHIFHSEDPGEAFHDHPWDYATFPIHDYVEEVLDPATGSVTRKVVLRFRITRRKAEHAHRILGRLIAWERDCDGGDGFHPMFATDMPVVTLVWRGRHRREWQYLVSRPHGAGWKVWAFPWQWYLRRADSKPRRDAA